MSTISQLKQVCEILEDAGFGDNGYEAEHDILYLLDEYEPNINEETKKQLFDLGVYYDDSDGLIINT